VVKDHDFMDISWWSEMAEYEKTAQAVEIPKEQPPPELIQKVVYPPHEKYKPSRFQIFTLAVSAVAILLMVVMYFLPPASRPVASITGDFCAVWDGPDDLLGSRLWNDGNIHYLKQGVAEITFDSGASLLVEAPSHLEALNENELYFDGCLTAKVPVSAHGFTVNTGPAVNIPVRKP